VTTAASPPTQTTAGLVSRALSRRKSLLTALASEGTDCYRLFHGVAEGRPGLAIDRYGPILLVQTWREPLSAAELEACHRLVEESLAVRLHAVWNHRNKKRTEPFSRFHAPAIPDDPVGTELGLAYDVAPRHRGLDPFLFLDLRAGRRRLLEAAKGRSILNLFSYTCAFAVVACAAGAKEVWNVDFSESALAVGARNLERNGIGGETGRVRFVAEDVFPVVRQLAALPVANRGSRKGRSTSRPRSFERFEKRSFDVVILDPPRWSKGPFGAVDVVRDYAALLKPVLLATAEGGRVLATNHAPEVEVDCWVETMSRCGEKCGRPLREVEVIAPEGDFPSFDGAPPSKVAWIAV
jgi:23S rRNA (cytosine1962-C5)-methyltransferase